MEEVIKIYDSEGFSKIIQGIKVVQTNKIANFESPIGK